MTTQRASGVVLRDHHEQPLPVPEKPVLELWPNGEIVLTMRAPGGAFWPRGVGDVYDRTDSEDVAEAKIRRAFGCSR